MEGRTRIKKGTEEQKYRKKEGKEGRIRKRKESKERHEHTDMCVRVSPIIGCMIIKGYVDILQHCKIIIICLVINTA
jgi:hypothetical protein